MCGKNDEQLNELKKERDKLIRAARACLSESIQKYFTTLTKIALIIHKDDLKTEHIMDIALHIFNGKQHDTCPEWCRCVDESGCWNGHKTTLPRHNYKDRHNKIADKYAFRVLVGIIADRFDQDNCNRLRGLRRTNANEVCVCQPCF